MTDEVWWVLMLSEAVGRPSLRALREWSGPELAAALVLDEAVSESARYARLQAEHDQRVPRGRR